MAVKCNIFARKNQSQCYWKFCLRRKNSNKRRINEFPTKAAFWITMGRNKSVVTLKIFAVFVPPSRCSKQISRCRSSLLIAQRKCDCFRCIHSHSAGESNCRKSPQSICFNPAFPPSSARKIWTRIINTVWDFIQPASLYGGRIVSGSRWKFPICMRWAVRSHYRKLYALSQQTIPIYLVENRPREKGRNDTFFRWYSVQFFLNSYTLHIAWGLEREGIATSAGLAY